MATISIKTRPIYINIDRCNSCGMRHYGVLFNRLTKPVMRNGENYTHIGKCPITGKGLLVRKVYLNNL